MNKIEADKIYSLHERAFFEEANKLLFGELFTKFFNEKTVSKTRKINLKEKKISSNIKDMSVDYTMVLDIQNLGFKNELPRERVTIGIYCCGREIMSFFPLKAETIDEKDDIKFSININYTKLSFLDKNNRALLNLAHDFGEKISEYQIEKGKKELKGIIKEGNEKLKKGREQIDKLIGESHGGSGGGGNGGDQYDPEKYSGGGGS